MKKQRRQQFDGGGEYAGGRVPHPRGDPSSLTAHAVPDPLAPGGPLHSSNNAPAYGPASAVATAAIASRATGGGGRVGSSADYESGGRKSNHRRAGHRRGSSSWSVRSWDSHAHYQDFTNDDEDEDECDEGLFPAKPPTAILCYCDMSTFKTPRTILRVLLVVRNYLYR